MIANKNQAPIRTVQGNSGGSTPNFAPERGEGGEGRASVIMVSYILKALLLYRHNGGGVL